MDIDLLAKMVGDLILDNDEVALPGVGTFVAELMGASFSDKGFVINPPYRKLSFRQREGDPDLLIDLYARTNQLDKATAAEILTRFLSEMKEVLKTKKYIIFPGLGRLRATRENLFFFVPDENLNIYPEGFGLEPVSLKSHEELTEITELKETVEAVADLTPPASGLPVEPAMTPSSEPAMTPSSEPAMTPSVDSATTPLSAPADKTATSALQGVPPQATLVPAQEEAAPLTTPVPAQEEAAPMAPPIPPEEEASPMATPVLPQEEAAPLATLVPPQDTAPQDSAPQDSAPQDTTPQDAPAPAPALTEQDRPCRKASLKRTLLLIACIIVGALLLLAILGRVAPKFVDRFLYSPEELELLYK